MIRKNGSGVNTYKSILFWLFGLTLTINSFSQSSIQTRADLEKKRVEIQNEIEQIKQSLDQTNKSKKNALGQLALLQRRLHLRETAIANVNQQINYIKT